MPHALPLINLVSREAYLVFRPQRTWNLELLFKIARPTPFVKACFTAFNLGWLPGGTFKTPNINLTSKSG